MSDAELAKLLTDCHAWLTLVDRHYASTLLPKDMHDDLERVVRRLKEAIRQKAFLRVPEPSEN